MGEQQGEWDEHCTLLGVSIPYPYSLEDIIALDDAFREASLSVMDWPDGARRGEAFNSFVDG